MIRKNFTNTCQSRNFCFTAWNEDFSLDKVKALFDEYSDIIRGILIGDEIAPTTGKRHFQGFIQFVNKKTKGGAYRILKDTFKINYTKGLYTCGGSEQDNDIYCSKSGKTLRLGSFKKQGYRTDLEQIYKDIDDGRSLLYICRNYRSQWTQYRRSFEKYKQLIMQEQTQKLRKIHVTLVSGTTETYKTSTIFKDNDPTDTFLIDGADLQWFDGYNGQKTLIIDEYHNDVKITQLLKLLDRFPKRLSTKGGFTYANWTKVFITTNKKQLHENACEEHIKALNRRIHTHYETFRDRMGKVYWQDLKTLEILEIAKEG